MDEKIHQTYAYQMYTQEEPEKSTKYQNVSGQHHKVYDIVFNVIIESNVQKIICKKYSDIYN